MTHIKALRVQTMTVVPGVGEDDLPAVVLVLNGVGYALHGATIRELSEALDASLESATDLVVDRIGGTDAE